MNKKVLAVVLVVVLALIYVLTMSKDSTENMMVNDDAMMQQEEGAMMEKESETEGVMEVGEAMMKQEDEVDGAMMKEDEVEGAMMQLETSLEADGAMMMQAEESPLMAGVYEDFRSEKLIWAEDGKVVLFFKADWCPSCNSLDKDIKANMEDIPANLHILKVDYDNSTELKKKYGVTTQHTFVQVDAEGNLIKKWIGSSSLTKLAAQVQ